MMKVFTHLLIPKGSVGFPPSPGGVCLFAFASFLIHAQEREVSGTVYESGQPLAVTLSEKSTSATTMRIEASVGSLLSRTNSIKFNL